MHLTVDQWIKFGSLASAIAGFYTFLHVIYRRMLRPIFLKISAVIEEERKFRKDVRATILTVNEFKEFFATIKSEMIDLVDLIHWAAAMRTYADVRIMPNDDLKAKVKAKAVGSEKDDNGGIH